MLEEDIIEGRQLALAAAEAAQSKKGQNLTIIDVDGQCSYTDFLVIVTAYSDRQTSAIAHSIADEMRKKYGLKPITREGHGSWILIDYGDAIVHVFHEDTRAYYNLDALWVDAPRVQVPALATI